MRLHSLLPLLALLAVQAVAQSDTITAEDPPKDAGSKTNSSTETRLRYPSNDEILGQMPPISPIRTGNPQMDAFYMMFPALGSLLRWGSLFPAYSILGAIPDGLQPTAAASKVVLVLAEDATAKTRVARQNPAVPNPFPLLTNWPSLPQEFQIPNMDFAPQVGAFLAQMPQMPAMPALLGAAAPNPAPVAPAPAAPAAASPAAPDAPPAPAAASPETTFQQSLLGQMQSIMNPANFDATTLLGQGIPALAPIPANMDFVSQMQKQFFPQMSSPASVAQASDISEVRVRPEMAQLAQQKIKATLEKEQEKQEDQEQVPLLWFRMPSGGEGQDATEEKTLEDLRVEAKLRAFERQVIAELKMLQKIELLAKQMRSNAAQSGDPSYRISYPLSRTPVHKITRADIEQALRDDYVRRLVNKEAQRKARNSGAGGQKRQAKAQDQQQLSKEDIVQIMAYAYRMANEQMEGEKGKQDKMYAAYRTGENQAAQQKQTQEMMQQQQQPMMQQQPRQMMPDQQQIQQNPMMQQQRQWTEEQARIQKERQWTEDQAKIQQGPMVMQQRQWTEEQARSQQMAQQAPMMMQQRQMEAQPNPMMMQQMQQRQWTEDPQVVQQMQQRHWAEENEHPGIHPQMMMQQRQWSEEQAKIEQQNAMMMQQMQQRQWSEEQAKIQQQQQQERQMMKQRQWAEENPQMMMQQQQQQRMEDPEQNMPNNQEMDEPTVGDAGPQMPENEGIARHKVDSLGLGGNKRKKSKSAGHTVVNYYYSAPAQRPAVQNYGSSYGTSYGGGGYGSNAYGVPAYPASSGYQSQGYRAAVGNDEVDDMLRRHQTMARTINPQQPGQVGGSESSSNPPLATTPAPQEQSQSPQPQEHRVHKRLAIFHRFGRGLGDGQGNSTAKGCGCGRLDCRCGRSCQCGRSRGSQRSRCQCKLNRRSKRSVEYGTLETIDEGSLNELRREYKLGLKEITLSPDEDPAEALMRYNAASIREALERASMEPLEIGGDQYEEGQEQQEPVQQEEVEQVQHDSQYNHRDFVRLTTSTAAPTMSTTSSTEATTTSGGRDSTSEATPSTTTESGGPKDEDSEMQQDSVAHESSHVTKSISKQEQEIHHLHTIVDELKVELIKLNLRCSQIISNNVTKEEPPKEEEKQEQTTVEQEEEQEEEEEGTSTTTSTSACTTTTTTETPPPKAEPKSNAIYGPSNKLDYEDDTNWQRILANRGYDTDYLTKSHEAQFSQGQNLEMTKPCNYENNASQEYSPYPEFQADEPTNADTEGKAKRALSVKQQAQLLNAALNDSGGSDSSDASPTTPTPYAMRGKFVRRRSTARRIPSPRITKETNDGWVRSTRQVRTPQRPKKKVTTSSQVTTQATVSSTKLDSLVDVLKDLLRLQIQREKKSSLLRSQSNPSKTPTTKSIKPIKVIKRKRLRRRQHKPMATTIRSSIQPKA
nr:defective chorion-1 protein, FC177 isoform isoform X2 [Drosophila takahashii]